MEKDICLKDYALPISKRTCIMGILNITPDSFSDGGEFLSVSGAVERAMQMEAAGADIIDIGGESSRPGRIRISEEEELRRVLPVIKRVRKAVKAPLSIDTCKSEVAREALSLGVSIVNDITALKQDAAMAGVIAQFSAGVILMHMKGEPENMQDNPAYDDVIEEISLYLKKAVDSAIAQGISSKKIIIDPGIGFGKTLEHNLCILKNLKEFKKLGMPILIGTSRKSFIGTLTSRSVKERDFASAASFALAIENGANIIRVHDVSSARDVARVTDAITRF